jgi:hypothetical protein
MLLSIIAAAAISSEVAQNMRIATMNDIDTICGFIAICIGLIFITSLASFIVWLIKLIRGA